MAGADGISVSDDKTDPADEWIPAFRNDDVLIVKPVDSQDDRPEGGLIETDEWLVRDLHGETYTVSDETFEDAFEYANSHAVDRLEFELPFAFVDKAENFLDSNQTLTLVVDALYRVSDQSYTTFDVVEIEVGDDTFEGSIPMEVIEDLPIVDHMDKVKLSEPDTGDDE